MMDTILMENLAFMAATVSSMELQVFMAGKTCHSSVICSASTHPWEGDGFESWPKQRLDFLLICQVRV